MLGLLSGEQQVRDGGVSALGVLSGEQQGTMQNRKQTGRAPTISSCGMLLITLRISH